MSGTEITPHPELNHHYDDSVFVEPRKKKMEIADMVDAAWGDRYRARHSQSHRRLLPFPEFDPGISDTNICNPIICNKQVTGYV